MNLDEINKNTKVGVLIKEYPWLVDEVKKLSSRAANLSPMVIKMVISHMTLEELAKKAEEPVDEMIDELKKLIRQHEGK